MKSVVIGSIVVGALAINLSGCSTTKASNVSASESPSTYLESENQRLKTRISTLEGEKSSQESELSARMASFKKESLLSANANSSTLPPNPEVGSCYARVYTAPKYETMQQTVLVKPESVRLEFQDPEYTWVEEKVLVSEASERIEVVPATYKTVSESLLVSDESTRYVEVPAEYKTVSEKILVKPAYTTWKKGAGPIEKVNETTGEIMCLVEVPAEYRTVSKRVLVQEAASSPIVIPAKYTEVTRRVVDEPSFTKKVVIPAKYKTVKVRKLVSGPKELKKVIPAEYKNITTTNLVEDSKLEWRTILCETNTSADLVKRLQAALDSKGYNPGQIDGILGRDTLQAVSKYQKDNKLASGQLTMNTLKHLGVNL